MKKIIFLLCIICFVVDLVLCFIDALYMDAIRDIALILLAIMMSPQFLKKNKAGD
jgi:hypothetical protein